MSSVLISLANFSSKENFLNGYHYIITKVVFTLFPSIRLKGHIPWERMYTRELIHSLLSVPTLNGPKFFADYLPWGLKLHPISKTSPRLVIARTLWLDSHSIRIISKFTRSLFLPNAAVIHGAHSGGCLFLWLGFNNCSPTLSQGLIVGCRVLIRFQRQALPSRNAHCAFS